jgi:hypothetical protein
MGGTATEPPLPGPRGTIHRMVRGALFMFVRGFQYGAAFACSAGVLLILLLLVLVALAACCCVPDVGCNYAEGE